VSSEILESGIGAGAELAAIPSGPDDGVDHDNADVDIPINPISCIGQSQDPVDGAIHVVSVVGILTPVTDHGEFNDTWTTGGLSASLQVRI
jgi:hypothetical protein